MLMGSDFFRIEERISNVLCSNQLTLKESQFVQNISAKIARYRKDAFINERQASWLFNILRRVERIAKVAPAPIPIRISSKSDNHLGPDASETGPRTLFLGKFDYPEEPPLQPLLINWGTCPDASEDDIPVAMKTIHLDIST